MTNLEILKERREHHKKIIAENESVIEKSKMKIRVLEHDVKTLRGLNNELRAIIAELEIIEAQIKVNA